MRITFQKPLILDRYSLLANKLAIKKEKRKIWTEFNFKEASFYQNLIREKIPMIFEQECPFKVKDDKIPLNQPPDPVEALGTGLRTIYDGLSMNEDFFE